MSDHVRQPHQDHRLRVGPNLRAAEEVAGQLGPIQTVIDIFIEKQIYKKITMCASENNFFFKKYTYTNPTQPNQKNF